MSIMNKIIIAQEKINDIFDILQEHDVEISEEKNLNNLKNDIQNYFDQQPSHKEYTIIDYVYSNGNQYIDTGIKMKNNIGVELKFKFENWDNQESLGGFIAGDIECNILKNNGGNLEASVSLTDNYIVSEIDSSIHTLIYNTYGRRLLMDDISKTFIRSIERGDINENLLIFANSANGKKPTGRIYNCKIYDNVTGEILRYFVPIIDMNDTACLYDMVEQKFYYSAGDEDFY